MSESRSTDTTISPDDLYERLQRGDAVSIVDVRNRDEFDAWHVTGENVTATQIPYNKFIAAGATGTVDALARESFPDGLGDETGPIVAVCAIGKSSAHVAELLREVDIDTVNLAEGMEGWARVYVAVDVPAAEATVRQYQRPSSGCLSYLVVNDGEAAVIDPLRTFAERYVTDARESGAELRYAVDTHVHADHVSGVRAVGAESGATVVMPEGADARGLDFGDELDVHTVGDGEELPLGDVTLTAVATPGHTTEMTSYRLGDLLFTGDTLFVESVARPDLERGDEGATDLARTLYATLHGTILALPDDVRIAPGHFSDATEPADDGTYTVRVGDARERLRALSLDETAFVEHVVGDLPPRPGNFERVIETNLGRVVVDDDEAFDLELGPNNCAVSPTGD